jgi:glycosyltransferase involved in cell wall biosynthesis
VPGLRFEYYDLPRWARWWKRGERGRRLHYSLWQFGAYRPAKRLYREVGIDLVHHVTYNIYWRPSLLALLPVPFIWGPVGGGETTPKGFRDTFSLRGRIYEQVRDLARWLGERDPFVPITARRNVLALATTRETAGRLYKLGAKSVKVQSGISISEEEVERLYRHRTYGEERPRFVSIGRLLHWKGLHWGLRAFAESGLPAAEYWILGDGPERRNLQVLAEELGIAHRVRFWGSLPREDVLCRLGECHILVHPSLHDSGGWVCLEAMAAGCPVVCLDLGGPAMYVSEETGFKIPAVNPKQAVSDLAAARHRLGEDHNLRARAGEAAHRRVIEHFNLRKTGLQFAELYKEAREAASMSYSVRTLRV